MIQGLPGISEQQDRAINAHVKDRMAYERKWAKWNADFDTRLAATKASIERLAKVLAA